MSNAQSPYEAETLPYGVYADTYRPAYEDRLAEEAPGEREGPTGEREGPEGADPDARQPDRPEGQRRARFDLPAVADDRFARAADRVIGQAAEPEAIGDRAEGLGVMGRGEDHREVGRGAAEPPLDPGRDVAVGRLGVRLGREGRGGGRHPGGSGRDGQRGRTVVGSRL